MLRKELLYNTFAGYHSRADFGSLDSSNMPHAQIRQLLDRPANLCNGLIFKILRVSGASFGQGESESWNDILAIHGTTTMR